MMKRILFLISLLLVTGCLLVRAQVYKFDFTSDKKVKEGFIKVTSETLFNDEQGYGYDCNRRGMEKAISLSSSPSMFPMAIIK